MTTLRVTWPIRDIDMPLSALLHEATLDVHAALGTQRPAGPPTWTIAPAKPRGLALTIDVPLSAPTPPRPVRAAPQEPLPCGTHAAFNRHRKRGETPCGPCVVAERDYQRARKRASRARGAAA